MISFRGLGHIDAVFQSYNTDFVTANHGSIEIISSNSKFPLIIRSADPGMIALILKFRGKHDGRPCEWFSLVSDDADSLCQWRNLRILPSTSRAKGERRSDSE